MRGLVELAIEKRAIIYFLVVLTFVGGIASYFALGKLEDPNYTVKTAVIYTPYPGASPEQVELEVTDRIEKAIQELPQLRFLYSFSRAGLSIITLDIKDKYWSDVLPQVWDEMRKKIRDVIPQLPPGAGKPDISDDFNFVFGFVLAVTGDGFSYKALEDYADAIKKELDVTRGVARVDLWGQQDKVIYVDVSEQQLAALGLTDEAVIATLRQQNLVVDAGFVDVHRNRLRVEPTGEFTRPEEIGELQLRASDLDTATNAVAFLPRNEGVPATDADPDFRTRPGDLIRLKDIATIHRGYKDPPKWLMRFNGQPAVGIQLSPLEGSDVIRVGQELERRLAVILPNLPVGLEVHKVAWQSDLVRDSIQGFLVNLGQAVAIVLIVLIIPSGFRMGMIIAFALVTTIMGTFIFMAMMGINLQRMSLGALVIAMGMMVDNAIVVSEGIALRIRRGEDRKQAAIAAAAGPALPLLSATIVAVMAFFPIYASQYDAGEYCNSLFTVVAAALIFSWVVALFITPMQCMDFIPGPKNTGEGAQPDASADAQPADEFNTGFYNGFRNLVGLLIRMRFVTVGVLTALLLLAFYKFDDVKRMFFPDSARAQLMIDYWAPEGTRINQVAEDMKPIEAKILESPLVASVSNFIGQGPPRFYLPVDPEVLYETYAELIINFHNWKDIDAFIEDFEPWLNDNVPQAMTRVRKYGVGPSDTWKFEARISGPAEAKLSDLRAIGNEVAAILEAEPSAKEIKLDIRNRVKKLVPVYSQQRGRWAATTREDIGRATRRANDGLVVGLYREGDDLNPIVLRHIEDDRRATGGRLETLQVQPTLSPQTVPLAQVTDGIRTEWEDPLIVRWNRRRTVSVQASPHKSTFPSMRDKVLDKINDVKLPPGYELFWGGEYDSQGKNVFGLIPGMIPAFALILFCIIAVFNAFRPLLIILVTIPFAMIGVTFGLLWTDQPMGFLAILGTMSLAGMMNKNIVVLLDAANDNLANDMSPYNAIVEAAVSRLKPVLLAAATTVLGVVPLRQDPFWIAMAVTIMFGLAVGSFLTMFVVPVLYCIFYRIQAPAQTEQA